MIASGRQNQIGFWQRFGRLLLAPRLPFEPLPNQRLCSRSLPAILAHFVRPLLPVWLLGSLVWLLPSRALNLLPHRRAYDGPLLPTSLRLMRPFSPVGVLSAALNPFPSVAQYAMMAAKPNRVVSAAPQASALLAVPSLPMVL